MKNIMSMKYILFLLVSTLCCMLIAASAIAADLGDAVEDDSNDEYWIIKSDLPASTEEEPAELGDAVEDDSNDEYWIIKSDLPSSTEEGPAKLGDAVEDNSKTGNCIKCGVVMSACAVAPVGTEVAYCRACYPPCHYCHCGYYPCPDYVDLC